MAIKIGVVSLGCAKNRVDSEIILGNLIAEGYEIVSDPSKADVIVVNTCGFIGPAKEESINTILEMAEYKKTSICKGLIVSGCLSARYNEELLREIPEIDGLLGTNELDLVPKVVKRILAGERISQINKEYFSYDDSNIRRLLTTSSHTAYLKIAEGCSHSCAFCVIPKIRGPYRSRSKDSILREARNLVKSGVRELVLIAQDTTEYGRDLGKLSLTELLKDLVSLDVDWIRVLYTYPTMITDEFLTLMASEEKIVKYVDLPLQHVSRNVLQAMCRAGDYQTTLDLIAHIRQLVPGVTIRSSFIVGFPGETDEDFRLLIDFLQEAALDYVGIFQFSPEEDTKAFSMPNQVLKRTAKARRDKAMKLQQKISHQANLRRVNKILPVMVDGASDETDLVVVGRHPGQAPEVDGVVYIGNPKLTPGEIISVKITEAHPYDLVGEVWEGDPR